MEDESSTKAVTLLPSTHTVAPPCVTPPPTTATITAPATTAKTTASGSAPSFSPVSVTNSVVFHPAQSTPEGFPQCPPQSPPPPTEPSQSMAHALASNAASGESDSNDEQPLFQCPQMSTPSLVLQARPPWCAVSVTPPSALRGGAGRTSNGNGANGLFPASALHAEFASNSTGQSISLGRDLSNHHPPTSVPKQQRSTGAATNTVRSAIPVTYVDSSNSESISNASVGTAGRVGGLHGGPHTNAVGAHRSLFRSVAPVGSAVPASPVVVGPSRWGQRLQGDDSGSAVTPRTPITPALAGDAVLVMEPPTPAKQRRTIHIGATAGGSDGGGYANFGPRLSTTTTTSAASTNPYSSLGASAAAAVVNGAGAASPPKAPTRTMGLLCLPPTSPSLPRATTPSTTSGAAAAAAPSLSFKFHKREGSRKRSADVLSQFSALDLDETPATPYGQTVANGRFNSLGGGTNNHHSSSVFPSQPSASMAVLRGATTFCPASPLIGGYATPVTLSQQIGGSNTFSQMLLHPSQDGLDMSQADTECSNFLARRIVNDYNEVRLLGRGSFGTVSLYKEISSGDYVAVKVSPPLRAADMERRYRRERSIMGMARGMPHVVQLSAAWAEGRVPRMYLQLEYCPGGCLAALASAKQRRHEPWAEEEVKVFLVHMSIALDALHRANIAHVDFKPDNVLIDKNGAYKLSDFGCSVLLDDNGRPRAETQNGYETSTSPSGKAQPQPHLAQQGRGGGKSGNNADNNGHGSPASKKDAAEINAVVTDFNWNEVNETSTASVDEGDCRYLCADMLNEKKYFKAGDMFSLGMSLYELMSGQPLPRNGDQFLALRRQVPVEMLRRRGYSPALVKLVAALLHSDPTQRPTARQVLQYLRPSAAELQLLADPSAMQQWTTSADTFTALQEQKQHESDQRSDDTAIPRATGAALRYVSALMEGSSWLLTTTQQDVHRALAKTTAEGEDEEGEQYRLPQQQQQQQQRDQHCPPLPPPHHHRCDALEAEMDGLPMLPIMREEACTPTTLNY
ncbi:putative serine/threonine-protein kinase [Leptomonas pyrrhocoris]|uniref:Putative serine/threonine-protein kinase n=1 Tax=Leptomonas pyrrhocoris TaxID=157538 RepID=A0A0N0VG18_LEPPY|nr:putative serine/threonine-protein kinase [Leptomonas pyrrhocoris]KPA82124.1 putative serine/threonine-protein kinase [Leptomonas pyrrhocoris]|eukprot:XP_015660563.1 putative serine/threonine-protein kinase [Leptomonas pyrrhocoris]